MPWRFAAVALQLDGSRDKGLFLAVEEFGAWGNGMDFGSVSQGCQSFYSGLLSII